MSVKRKIKQLLNKANLIRIVREREVSVPYVINLDKKGRLNGKVAVVTGGSGVIGRAIAFRLAAEGAKVYVCGSRKEKATPVASEILQRIHKTNWLNGYGKPEDIAGMVAYLNTEEASFITGQNFVVDGGRSLGLKNN